MLAVFFRQQKLDQVSVQLTIPTPLPTPVTQPVSVKLASPTGPFPTPLSTERADPIPFPMATGPATSFAKLPPLFIEQDLRLRSGVSVSEVMGLAFDAE